jgi:hypothetical protein
MLEADPPLHVTVRPKWIQIKKGSGGVPVVKAQQVAWLASGFRLTIPGLDCERIVKIDSITVKMGSNEVEISDVVVTLDGAHSASWRDWLQSVADSRSSADSEEKSGDLILLAPDAQHEVARIHLYNLGISSLASQPKVDPDQIPSQV